MVSCHRVNSGTFYYEGMYVVDLHFHLPTAITTAFIFSLCISGKLTRLRPCCGMIYFVFLCTIIRCGRICHIVRQHKGDHTFHTLLNYHTLGGLAIHQLRTD